MTRVRRLVLTVGMVCGLAAPCVAVPPPINVNGTYQISVVDNIDNCTANGQATLTQAGSTFTGVITLTVVSGTGCPAPFGTSASGNLTGNLTGNTITLGFATNLFGRVVFTTGTISNDGNVASGTWTQTGGSAGGAWSAIRTHQAGAPALSARSLAGLALLLAWFGIRRRATRNAADAVA